MNKWTKIALLIAFHGLMMTDYYYWEKARNELAIYKTAEANLPAFRAFALSELDTLGYVLLANVTMIALLVVWLCFARKRKPKDKTT